MLLPRLAGLAAALAVLPAAGCGDGDGAAAGCPDIVDLYAVVRRCDKRTAVKELAEVLR